MNKKVINISLLVVGLLSLYFAWRLIKKKSPISISNNTSSSSSNASSIDCDGHDPQKPVYYGNKNCEVKALQCRLNHYEGTSLVKDGILGDNTLRALTQKGYSLPIKAGDIGDSNEILTCS